MRVAIGLVCFALAAGASMPAIADTGVAQACGGVAQYIHELSELLDPEISKEDAMSQYTEIDSRYGRDLETLRIVMGESVEALSSNESTSPFKMIEQQHQCIVFRNCDAVSVTLSAMSHAEMLIYACQTDFRRN